MIKLTRFHPSIPSDKVNKYGYAPEHAWVNPALIAYITLSEQYTVFEMWGSPKVVVTEIAFFLGDPIVVTESPQMIEALIAEAEPIRPALPATPAQRPRT